MEVVAEGVENREQLEVLKNLECFYIQGYYFNKPLPRPEFDRQYQKREVKRARIRKAE